MNNDHAGNLAMNSFRKRIAIGNAFARYHSDINDPHAGYVMVQGNHDREVIPALYETETAHIIQAAVRFLDDGYNHVVVPIGKYLSPTEVVITPVLVDNAIVDAWDGYSVMGEVVNDDMYSFSTTITKDDGRAR